MAKNNNSLNLDKVIRNLSPDSKASDKPWFKKKTSIIAMGSTLGVAGLATVIAVPVALTTGSTTVVTPSTPEEIAAAISVFNKKTNTEKISAYNSMVNNITNISNIRDYMFKQGGMKEFFNTNVKQVTEQPANSKGVLETFNKFKDYLLSTVPPTPKVTANGFLSVKGEILSNQNIIPNKELHSNVNAKSINCVYEIPTTISSTSREIVYTFYSIAASTITNITLNTDFSMTITLPMMSNISKNYNFAFELDDIRTTVQIDNQRYGSLPIEYKQQVTFSNSTLFPDMSNYVKTSILKLT